jgi:hypothetical protein
MNVEERVRRRVIFTVLGVAVIAPQVWAVV